MKRWIVLIALVIGLSSVATYALQTKSLTSLSASKRELAKTGAPAVAAGPKPKIVFVEGGPPTYEFGIMPQRTDGKHTWIVKNEGEGDLELVMESSTCSCTLAKFKNGEKAIIKPGQSEPIDLEFETRENNGPYQKGAKIATNDPEKPAFDLQVKGMVFPPVLTYPSEPFLNFATVSNDEDEHVGYMAVFSKDRPETKVTKISTGNPNVVVTQEPIAKADLDQMQIKSGTKIAVKVKSGMPLGFFKEEVVITTDHPKQKEIRIGVGGRMTGAISVNPAAVIMHQTDGALGGSSDITMFVRNLKPTKFEVVKKPEGVEVSVGPTNKEGRYKLTVSVPAGTKSGKIDDEIVITTDNPKADKVIVPVNIWILNSK